MVKSVGKQLKAKYLLRRGERDEVSSPPSRRGELDKFETGSTLASGSVENSGRVACRNCDKDKELFQFELDKII